MSNENCGAINNERENADNLIAIKTVEKPPIFTPISASDGLRILLITQGRVTAHIDGEINVLQKDDVAVICPKSLLALNCSDDLQYVEITVNISPAQEKLGRYLHFINGSTGAPTFVKNGNAEYADVFCAANKLVNSQNDISESVERLLIALFNHRKKDAEVSLSKSKQRYAVTLILKRVYQISQTIVIDDVANACGYSEFYTMKLFKQYTGDSIVDYSNKYRLYVAYDMLLSTDKSVREIAQSVGFTNISYFNRQFKRTFNATPLTVRAHN